jgi:hypothetical protein
MNLAAKPGTFLPNITGSWGMYGASERSGKATATCFWVVKIIGSPLVFPNILLSHNVRKNFLIIHATQRCIVLKVHVAPMSVREKDEAEMGKVLCDLSKPL